MDQSSAEKMQDHAMRSQAMGLMPRAPEGIKTPDPFLSTQQMDNMMRRPAHLEQGREGDFSLDKKMGMGPEKIPKQPFPPSVGVPAGMGGNGKRMGGDDKGGDVDDINNREFVNPLLYKPASKPPVIKEGDWLCPEPTVGSS
jgi:hypothetical protein